MTLTKSDLDQIDRRLDRRLKDFKDEILEEVRNMLQNLKSEFFNRIDPIFKKAFINLIKS